MVLLSTQVQPLAPGVGRRLAQAQAGVPLRRPIRTRYFRVLQNLLEATIEEPVRSIQDDPVFCAAAAGWRQSPSGIF